MIYFFDTSALVKYYTDEKGSGQITDVIQDSKTYIFISELTCIEIKSSFATKCRTGQITQNQWQIATMAFDESLTNFYVRPINEAVILRAEWLIQTFAVRYALRTLDAIQLATYQQLTYSNVILASADDRLNLLAREFDHIVWNPNSL